ncbi:DMT family transporter [Streptomyces zingiberis]|uniref:DMT family transporter n=1 Tax=Streptomyces zingiberis TaxID=2053010 RepID=A0ABX1BRY4_9ACTN|nr:DMT family transporter [Streptomyces zingiberis]NJQ00495.1 DMT family transporter [Streptomyces zingiberis]
MRFPSVSPVGRGVLCVAVAATAWGTGGAVASDLYATGGLGPLSVSFWRFLIGLVLLLAVHAARGALRPATRHTPRPVHPRNSRWLLITGAGMAVYQTAYFAAVGEAGLTVATVVTLGAGPVLITVGGRFLLDERVGATGAVAVAAGALGLVLLTGGADEGTGPDPAWGIAYALLSATGYAAVTLRGRAAGRRNPAGSSGTATPLGLAIGLAAGTVCLAPAAVAEGLLPTAGDPARTVLSLLYLGAVPTALAYTLFFAGLRTVRAATASVIALVEPLTAAALGIALLGERLNAVSGCGAALLLLAVLALTSGERRPGAIPEDTGGAGAGRVPREPSPGPEENISPHR